MVTFILLPQRLGLFKDLVIQKGIGSLSSVIFDTLMKVFYERDDVITKKILNYLTAQFALKVIPF